MNSPATQALALVAMRPRPCVLVLSGLPGCGKSYVAHQLYAGYVNSRVVSADNLVDYENFSPDQLAPAHQGCFRAFLAATQLERAPLVVVDNTNLSAAEVAPYYLLVRLWATPWSCCGSTHPSSSVRNGRPMVSLLRSWRRCGRRGSVGT